jgi:hypothetical protein
MLARFVVLFGVCALASSCSHVLEDMKKRAAFDFNCPEDQITVSALGGYAYGAKGCGRSLKCNDVPYAGLLCSEPQGDPPAPAERAAP